MKSMAASEFKAKCLNVIEHLPAEGLQITKRGRVVARIYPEDEGILQFLGALKGSKIEGDILSTGAKWDAES